MTADARPAGNVVRVTGTSDPVDIAALVAALQARGLEPAQPSAYERWRGTRLAALRRSRRRASSSGV